MQLLSLACPYFLPYRVTSVLMAHARTSLWTATRSWLIYGNDKSFRTTHGCLGRKSEIFLQCRLFRDAFFHFAFTEAIITEVEGSDWARLSI